jgi:diadenosine tetraphosphate (Ap4A) HIT family hydrolase
MSDARPCLLCHETGGQLLWQDELCRLVLVDDADYPGFCRVVWARHVAEMTDLVAAERRHLMAVVFAAESALRAVARPDKVNLASFGNRVPHLHWHIVPRWRDDRHFPEPVWGAPLRDAPKRTAVNAQGLLSAFVAALAEERGG